MLNIFLLQASLRHQHEDPPLASDPKLQTLLLSPLVELSAIPHPDIRARQLDCVMQILHSSAERLTQGWPLLITVIGSLRPQHPEAVVKTAFQVKFFHNVFFWRESDSRNANVCLSICLKIP